MKKIIVAGCGHGGLYAAYKLAKAGYSVEVFEKKDRYSLGYDWHDCFYKPDFDRLGIDIPECDKVFPFFDAVYTNPKKTVKLKVEQSGHGNLYNIDRIYLINKLIDMAISAGTVIHFGTDVTGAIVKNNAVTGIIAGGEEIYGDLVIDAAGIDSPVRQTLPESFGIMGKIPKKNTFYCYRVYYENTTGEKFSPPQTIYFYHCNKAGMDWAVTEEKYIDILVGRFNPINDDDVREAVEDIRNDIPFMGDKIVRGGSFERIPLRIPIPLFVWNGYAAVGDSAGMTEPMSGSGINNSINAGDMLADTVIKARGGKLTLEALWSYQYNYFIKFGEKCFAPEITRKMLSSLSAEDIDYFFEKKILTEKEISAGGLSDSTPGETLSRIIAFIPKLNLLPSLSGIPYRTAIGERAKKFLPEKYSYNEYMKWRKEYEKI